jgi:uncharacterized protein (TIGR03067 family)
MLKYAVLTFVVMIVRQATAEVRPAPETAPTVQVQTEQQNVKTTITRPLVVLIEAQTKGIPDNAKLKAIAIPKETIGTKLLRDVRLKRKQAKGLDREYVVKTLKLTLSDDTVVECQGLLADDVPETTTAKNPQGFPVDAASEKGVGTWYQYLASYQLVVDPAKDPPARKKDMEKLQGTWRVVSSQLGDEKPRSEEELNTLVTIKGNKLTRNMQNSPRDSYHGIMNIDPVTKAFDFPGAPTGETMLGIYDLQGDDLKIAFGNDGVMRPKGFDPIKHDALLMVLKRQKP